MSITAGDIDRAAPPHKSQRWSIRTGRSAVRRGVLALLVGLAASLGPGAPAAAAPDPTDVESAFLARIANTRANHDLRDFQVGGTLTRVAREQARRMADRNMLFHNPELTSEVPNWRFLGENVGFGPDALTLHRAFMDSAPHRANILDTDFERIGVGAVVRDGRVWVSEVFKTPNS